MFARLCATDLRRFSQSKDAKALQRFLALRFFVPKTFNQDILQFCFPCCLAGYRIAGSGVKQLSAATGVINLPATDAPGENT